MDLHLEKPKWVYFASVLTDRRKDRRAAMQQQAAEEEAIPDVESQARADGADAMQPEPENIDEGNELMEVTVEHPPIAKEAVAAKAAEDAAKLGEGGAARRKKRQQAHAKRKVEVEAREDAIDLEPGAKELTQVTVEDDTAAATAAADADAHAAQAAAEIAEAAKAVSDAAAAAWVHKQSTVACDRWVCFERWLVIPGRLRRQSRSIFLPRRSGLQRRQRWLVSPQTICRCS